MGPRGPASPAKRGEHARGTIKTRLRPSDFGEVRPTQKLSRRHPAVGEVRLWRLAEAEGMDAFIPGQGRGLLRRRIKKEKNGAT